MEFEQWLIWLPEVFLIEVFTQIIGGISISQVLTKPDTHETHTAVEAKGSAFLRLRRCKVVFLFFFCASLCYPPPSNQEPRQSTEPVRQLALNRVPLSPFCPRRKKKVHLLLSLFTTHNSKQLSVTARAFISNFLTPGRFVVSL